MTRFSLAIAGFVSMALCVVAEDYTLHTFKKLQLSDQFWSEGASAGDFNHDGKMDVVSGPYWWEGPDFKKRHERWSAARRAALHRWRR